jgi:hypothetical protein
MEVRTNSLESDNERLKHELLVTREENEALRGVVRTQPPSNTMQPDRRRTVAKLENIYLPAQ